MEGTEPHEVSPAFLRGTYLPTRARISVRSLISSIVLSGIFPDTSLPFFGAGYWGVLPPNSPAGAPGGAEHPYPAPDH